MMFGPPKPMSEIMFNKFDTDKSGRISAQEFSHLCFSLGYALTDVELELALKVLDDDASGEIELNEFKNCQFPLACILTGWKREDRWQSIQLDGEELAKRKAAADSFNSFDADKSGSVSKENFKGLYDSLKAAGLTKQSEENALATMDVSGDGRLQFSEFIAWLKNQGIFSVALAGRGQ